MIRTFTELDMLDTFEERFLYLRLNGTVGESTFGYDRYLNQRFYKHNRRWRDARELVIIRDNGCDLGMFDYEIYGAIVIHHINPMTKEQIEKDSDLLYDPEFLVCTTKMTHNAIHYGDESLLSKRAIVRRPFDTCPWV